MDENLKKSGQNFLTTLEILTKKFLFSRILLDEN